MERICDSLVLMSQASESFKILIKNFKKSAGRQERPLSVRMAIFFVHACVYIRMCSCLHGVVLLCMDSQMCMSVLAHCCVALHGKHIVSVCMLDWLSVFMFA